MEMGIGMIITAIMSALSAMCSVGCLVVLLIMAAPKEGENPPDRPTDGHPPLGKGGKDNKNSGEWSEATFSRGGKQGYDKHRLKATPDDVEKRRRAAVQAREHSNFMDYDGTPQQPIDPSLILADGG